MSNRNPEIFSVKRCLLLFAVLAVLAPALCYGEAAILRLTYRNASEVLPLVEKLLSRRGRAAVDTQSNSLVIVDTPESVQRVQAFLGDLDRPVKQARIRVRFLESGSSQGASVSVEGGISGRNWTASTGRSRDGVDIRVGNKAGGQRERSEYYIQAS